MLDHNREKVSVFTPPYKFPHEIKAIDLLPPHSTIFYPKLPNGLISNYIISDRAKYSSSTGLEQVI